MKKKYLFVEGLDDCIVISNLCKERDIPNTFEVIKCDSKDNVLSRFDLEINEQATKNAIVGIVVDADTNAKNTWERVKSKIILTGAYDNVPKMIPTDGLIVESNNSIHPKIGVWIMPDNNINGMLEDFVRLLAYPDDVLMTEAEEVLQSLEKKEINKYKPVHRSKAKIHTFLAWQDTPGKPMGQAITSKILNAHSKGADLFIEWMRKLFNVIS